MTRQKNVLTRTLNLLVLAAVAAALLIPALTHEAPLGGWMGMDANTEALPVNIPKWDAAYASQFPGCTDHQGAAFSDLVVVDQRAQAHRVDFAAAWERGHNAEPADDVFVVGWCGR